MTEIALSVVSHRQGGMVDSLLGDLLRHCPDVELLLTENVPELCSAANPGLPRFQRLANVRRLGFGANHNQAFSRLHGEFFCVANPDVRLSADPFPGLLKLMADPRVGLIAPQVFSPTGMLEANARDFPTPLALLRKALTGKDTHVPVVRPGACEVNWVAGMFMLFRASAFADVGGFDEQFFLYYEDVDICARLWQAGWKVMMSPEVSVVHAAQRASHRQPRYLAWHLASMVRFFLKHHGRLPPRTARAA